MQVADVCAVGSECKHFHSCLYEECLPMHLFNGSVYLKELVQLLVCVA